MPIYEYVCRDCGHEFEALQKISDDPLRECPACTVDALHKKVSAAGFRLAGSGWYETDFKKDGKRNLAGGKSDAGAKTDSGAKADKPAASTKKDSKTTSSSTGSGGGKAA